MLASQYGEAKREIRVCGKKVDVYFEQKSLGATTRIYVEAKDYAKPLGREDVVKIRVDYEGIVAKHTPALLLIVTRAGLTPDAQAHIGENPSCRHQTIWEIEANLINFESYLRFQVEAPKETKLDRYYIPTGFEIRTSEVEEHRAHIARTTKIFGDYDGCLGALMNWIHEDQNFAPVAVLGGYGSGKSSLAMLLSARLAEESLTNPNVRQPVLIKLGGVSQYTNVEGLLGGYFTNDFPILNFNCHNFFQLNAKGKYVIFLDGFDEMKHAMSWSEFKRQVKNLLRLHGDRSKIVLLGRPSAFLSEIEDRYVLKGEKPVGESWVRLPDWPRFHELELKGFTKQQRSDFVRNYLAAFSEDSNGQELKKRAKKTNEIADTHTDLFTKPVHSKILTDLATDPNFELDQFESSSSRWHLYGEFIHSLYNREMEKDSRQGISLEKRLDFLREVSFWLWTEFGSKISFSIADVPNRLLSDFSIDDGDDKSATTRELLSGSILERKAGDVFFFGHRSFAEYLVADRLLRCQPDERTHTLYSRAFRDGVKEFLLDAKCEEQTRDWSVSFSHAEGEISQSYIEFLTAPFNSIEEFRGSLVAPSKWKDVLLPFCSDLAPTPRNYKSVFDSLLLAKPSQFAWGYCWLTQWDTEQWQAQARVHGCGQRTFDRQVLVALLNAFFCATRNTSGRSLTINSDGVGLRRICQNTITLYEFDGIAEFEFTHDKLSEACRAELIKLGIPWTADYPNLSRKISFNTDDFFNLLSKEAQDKLLIFLKHIGSWLSVTEVAEVKNRKTAKSEITKRRKPNHNIKVKKPRSRR
ncbi:MAG: hypothetical protein ABJO27_19285 [Pseudoruegeria sp.]